MHKSLSKKITDSTIEIELARKELENKLKENAGNTEGYKQNENINSSIFDTNEEYIKFTENRKNKPDFDINPEDLMKAENDYLKNMNNKEIEEENVSGVLELEELGAFAEGLELFSGGISDEKDQEEPITDEFFEASEVYKNGLAELDLNNEQSVEMENSENTDLDVVDLQVETENARIISISNVKDYTKWNVKNSNLRLKSEFLKNISNYVDKNNEERGTA